jgi:hypothetical protein
MNPALRRIALGLFVALAAFASLLMRGDGPPPGDADLMQTAAPALEHENGYATASAAAELLVWPEDAAVAERLSAMSSGERWDDDLAARALAANERALDTFARIARNPAFQSPAEPLSEPRIADAVNELVQLLAVRAIGAARIRKGDAAIEDALLILRIGKRIGGDPRGMLRGGTLGISASRAALRVIEAAVPQLDPAAEPSRSLPQRLLEFRIAPESWRGLLAAEYRSERALLLVTEKSPGLGALASAWLDGAEGSAARVAARLPAGYLIQPNNTLAVLAARVRVYQERAAEPCRRAAPPSKRALDVVDLLRPNAVGRRSVLDDPTFERADQSRCLHDTRIELLRAALAVRAFEQARGLLPPSLEALSPGSLEPAPIDGFSGAALRFDRAQRVIYSVGSDGLDGGGRAHTGELVGDAEALEPRLPLFAPWTP